MQRMCKLNIQSANGTYTNEDLTLFNQANVGMYATMMAMSKNMTAQKGT